MLPQFLITKIGQNELGDLAILTYFLEKMGFEVHILDKSNTINTDFIYISGIDTNFKASFLKQQLELGTACLAVGSGLAFCGKETQIDNKIIQGLNILDIQSELNSSLDMVFSSIYSQKYNYLMGYKQLGMEVFADGYSSLGTVKSGWGDNKLVKNSGIFYKNFIGINLQDNILVNNPALLEDILQTILNIKLKKQQITQQFYDFSKATLNSIDDNFSQLMQVENLESLKINL